MKQFSSAVTTLLATGSIKFFLLVEVGALKMTSLAADAAITNGYDSNGMSPIAYGTFSASSGLRATDPPVQNSVVDREAFKVYMADPQFAYRGTIPNGAPVVVRYGFLNSLNTTVTGANGVVVQPGQPLLDLGDTITSYSGFVSTLEWAINPTEDEVVLTIEGTGPLADLDSVNSKLATSDTLKMWRTDDTTCDMIYEGSAAIQLNWGRK